jgi:hypothetical protein
MGFTRNDVQLIHNSPEGMPLLPLPPLAQVVKGALGLEEPTLQCEKFMFEDVEGLDDDEVATYASHLGKVLVDLPGGGIVHGSTVILSDEDGRILKLLVQQQASSSMCLCMNRY